MIVNIATLKAKPGTEAELAEILKSYVAQISDEEGTLTYTSFKPKRPHRILFL